MLHYTLSEGDLHTQELLQHLTCCHSSALDMQGIVRSFNASKFHAERRMRSSGMASMKLF